MPAPLEMTMRRAPTLSGRLVVVAAPGHGDGQRPVVDGAGTVVVGFLADHVEVLVQVDLDLVASGRSALGRGDADSPAEEFALSYTGTSGRCPTLMCPRIRGHSRRGRWHVVSSTL